jgi:hypothetical protein
MHRYAPKKKHLRKLGSSMQFGVGFNFVMQSSDVGNLVETLIKFVQRQDVFRIAISWMQ